MHRVHFTAARSALVLLATLLLAAPVAEAQTKVKAGFNLFSATQDVEVGTASAAEVEKQLPLVTDRAVLAYVDEIGQRLAAKAGGPQFKYQFGIINASDINAFALPGGFVYINRGIVESSRNEGELAGVLAHEIAHVSLRHGTHQASKAYGAKAGLSILGGLLGDRAGDSTAGIINAVGGFGMNALFLKFSRELETQSDIRGAQILAAAGYTPADMVSFFQMLEKTDTARKTSWLSSHPAPPDRVVRIEREAQLLRVSSQPTQRVTELKGIQSRLRRLGTAPTMAQIASGQTTGSTTAPAQTASGVAPPSTRLRSFTSDSRAYRISYPENWKAYEQGTTGVVFAPEGGITKVGGRTEIVHGVILNYYEPFGNVSNSKTLSYLGDSSVEDATNDLIKQIQQGDPHLNVVKNSTRELDLDSGPALTAVLRGVNPRTNIKERLTVVTHQLDDENLIYLLFATPEIDAKSYSATLTAMVESIQIDDDFTN
ncbi:MAG: M48 family metallopeptidase [Thermoanaerobaculia bacterium]|nr:M48 family metallopeptidase [Thermoanaerobaculia bacterium]